MTEQLLLHHFTTVDLIEPSKHLIGTAEQNLSSTGREEYPAGHQAGQIFNMGLQSWTPQAGRYSVHFVYFHPAYSVLRVVHHIYTSGYATHPRQSNVHPHVTYQEVSDFAGMMSSGCSGHFCTSQMVGALIATIEKLMTASRLRIESC